MIVTNEVYLLSSREDELFYVKKQYLLYSNPDKEYLPGLRIQNLYWLLGFYFRGWDQANLVGLYKLERKAFSKMVTIKLLRAESGYKCVKFNNK